MLVLTRREGEELIIGDNIRIVILRVDGSYARVGIEAPQEVEVLRSELLFKARMISTGTLND
jgi:carbon storage regulator